MNRKQVMRRAGTVLTLLLLAGVLVSVAGAHAASPLDYGVTTPREFFGYDIGQDYKLTPWQTHELQGEGVRQGIVEYAHELERTSDRVHVFQYGTTEMGRPMILTVVTSPANWAQMDNLKGILRKLADPRQVASDEEAQWLASQGKAVYWLSAAIHSTERTSPEVLLRLGYDLAAGTDDWTLNLLDRTIVVLENSINPDGLDMVTDWYYQYKDTPYVSSGPPSYGKYVNHDDNRDFVGIALAESQANVDARQEWNPTVYHDLHEAQDLLYMSPGPDPTNLAVSPITMAEWLAFAGHNISQLIAQGWKGAFTYDYADMWYPGYNHGYTYMHNSNGRFYELTGATRATPRTITSGNHRTRAWYDPEPYTATVSSPLSWHLMDAVNFEEDAIKNDLTYTANNKDKLLLNFYLKAKTNTEQAISTAPYAFVIPQDGGDNADVTDMINNLHLRQHIEVDRAGTAFTADGQNFQVGDYVVRLDQPYGLTAKNLLTVQVYPPIKTPYDVTAWTYGLMRDVNVVALNTTLPAGLSLVPVTGTVPYEGTLTGDVSSRYVIENGSNNNLAVLLPRLWQQPDLTVWQADYAFTASGHNFLPGSLIVGAPGTTEMHNWLATNVQELGLTAYAVDRPVVGTRLLAPRLGVYTANTSSNTTMPEGWTRLRLDRAAWDFTRVYPSDIVSGTLDAYDVLVIPSMSQNTLINGTSSSSTPPEYRLGIGTDGVAKLKSFVENGGTLILQGAISTLPINQSWGISVTVPAVAQASVQSLPVSDDPEDVPDFGGPVPGSQAAASAAAVAFNCPGSILRIAVDPSTPLGYGYDGSEALWCESGAVFFELADGSAASVAASYPDDGQTLLLSGYISGEEALHGKAAIVDAPLGAGHVILLAPNVLYRAQSTGSFMFFWNALIEGSRSGQMSLDYLPVIFQSTAAGGE